MAASLNNSAWTEWVARLVGEASRQGHTATLPPQKFHCFLDEAPLHLIPAGVPDLPSECNGLLELLVLSPNADILPHGNVPTWFQERMDLLDAFHLQGTIAWVRDRFDDSLHPFWLSPRLESVISEIRAGRQSPSSLPRRDQLLLTTSGILSGCDDGKRRVAERSRKVDVAAGLFREKNYAPIGSLIHPFHLAALRRYYRHAIRKGTIRLGDAQSPRRYVAHNEPLARYFHHQIAKVVSAVVGETVKPSYVYFASYVGGAELKKHRDREQCEFSVSLLVDFSPEPSGATSWPICLDTPAGRVTVYQALGDGLIYRGTKVPHYRSVLREGYTSTSIFFHYVREDFSGSLD